MVRRIISKLSTKGKEAFRELLYSTGLKKHRIPPNKKMILCYHGIDLTGNTKLNSKFISRSYFEQQLIYFKKHFQLVSLEDFFKLKDQETELFTIAITFDDGYKNNFRYVLPLIEKHQIPAAFFITGIQETGEEMLLGDFFDLAAHHYDSPLTIEPDTYKKDFKGRYRRVSDGILLKQLFHESDFSFKKKVCAAFPEKAHAFKTRPEFNDYWQQMNADEIYKLSGSTFATIGSHGYYHNDLTKIPIDDAISELVRSKTYLESIIRKEVVDLAFPYGNYSGELIDKCREMGFRSLLSLEYLSGRREHILHNRFGMSPYISWNNQLHYLLKGEYK